MQDAHTLPSGGKKEQITYSLRRCTGVTSSSKLFLPCRFTYRIKLDRGPEGLEAQLTMESVGHTSSNSIDFLDMDAKDFGRGMVVVGVGEDFSMGHASLVAVDSKAKMEHHMVHHYLRAAQT